MEPKICLLSAQATTQVIGQEKDQARNHDNPEGQVDEEDGPPAEQVAHRAAQNRPETARGHDHQAGIALIPGPLARLEQIRIDGEDGHHDAAAAQPLEDARRNQRIHRPGEAAEDGAEGEEDDGGQHDVFAAKQIAELAVDGHDGAGGEEEGGADPAEALHVAELANNGGQSRGDDLVVQRRHEKSRHEKAEDRQPVAVAGNKGLRRRRRMIHGWERSD
jgi:hypothetical protein